jgi:DNA-binding response OmpR family regulator
MWPFDRNEDFSFSNIPLSLTRQQLIRRSRILVVDDERPPLISTLEGEGFSVHHDRNGDDAKKIEDGLYDLVILDFDGVGSKFGNEQGLSFLRHIRRVNPSIVVLAYSTKAGSKEADFFRLADEVLDKDKGVAESLEIIENALRKSMSFEQIWGAIEILMKIEGSQSTKIRSKVIKELKNGNYRAVRDILSSKAGGSISGKILTTLLEKLLELGVLALVAP